MRPELQEIRDWCDIGAGQLDDDQLGRIVSAETIAQTRDCPRMPLNVEDYPDDLAQALLRRVARAVALRATALGIVANGGNGEFGTGNVADVDSEIARYERPYRRLIVG